MEYCNQGDLGVLLKRVRKYEKENPQNGKIISEDLARHFIQHIGKALESLKNFNFIHRDIKPQNVLIHSSSTFSSSHDGDEDPKLTKEYLRSLVLKLGDFGFARYMSNFDLAETLCGSPLYMAPEILSYKKYNYKVDLWSVGCIAYELLFGHPPFRASNHVSLLKKMKAYPIELVIQQEKVAICIQARSLLIGLLQYDPIKRLSFEEFILHDFMSQKTASIHTAPGVAIPLAREPFSPASSASDVMDQMSQILTNTKLTTRRFSASSAVGSFKPSTYTAPGLDAYFSSRPAGLANTNDHTNIGSSYKPSPLFPRQVISNFNSVLEDEDKDFVVVSMEVPPEPPTASQLKRTILSVKRASFGSLPHFSNFPEKKER